MHCGDGVLGLVAARAQHQTVEQRCIPAMADVMQLELLPRSACLTAVLGAQQRVAADDGTEFSAHSSDSQLAAMPSGGVGGLGGCF
jgi:hypothetical protein